MSIAKQLRTKAAAETKDLVIDCASALADAEAITGTPTVTVSPPDDLTVTGIAVNESVLTEPGYPDAQIGQAIQFFVGAGTAGTTYTLTITYDTDAGQDLEAVCKLRVT
jgi:hypothetical protein